MPRFIKRASETSGSPSIDLSQIDKTKMELAKITVIDYGENEYQEKQVQNIEQCFPFKEKSTVTWINIDGLHNFAIIEALGNHFELHPLTLEDIANTNQRPKYEDFESYVYIVLNMLYLDEKADEVKSEQVSLVLRTNCVISFQETEGDVFNYVRERIRNAKGRIRKMGSDYLVYALVDAVVDNYFSIMEKIGEKIENSEEMVLTNATAENLKAVYNLKSDIIFLRKSIWPLRELISGLQRSGSKLIKKQTEIYMRDIYDHTVQAIDTIETYRDMISGVMDIYLSSVSNKMNEIMKVLTIIATIFIPLTFIAGIYGMNFKYMPELGWKFGYIMIWMVIIAVGGIMVLYFKKRNWL